MKTLIVSLVCVLFALVAQASEVAKIEGGVAAATNGKVAYYDFQKGKAVFVTDHLEGVDIKPPFAVSEDGEVLVWFAKDGKLHTCWLNGRGSEYEVKIDVHDVLGNELLTPAVDKMQSFTLSPKATRISFESELKSGNTWKLIPPGHPLDRAWKAQNGGSDFAADYMALPMYTIDNAEFFNGVMVWDLSKDRILKGRYRCGNSFEYPAVLNHRPTTILPAGTGGVLSAQISIPDILRNGESWPIEGCCQRYSYRRNAHFAAWSKDDRLMAVIYQTGPNSWGPIELRTSTDYSGNGRPKVYEIEMRLPYCKGLAWMPDGSLTIQTEDKVWRISPDQIAKGVANGTVTRPMKDTIYLGKVVVLNNVFQVKPVEVSTYGEVKGTKLCWVSNSAFIIRGDDGALYLHDLQNGGSKEQLLPKVPEDFYYCRVSQPDNKVVAKAEAPKATEGVVYPEAKSGTDRILVKYKGNDHLRVGHFGIGWELSKYRLTGDSDWRTRPCLWVFPGGKTKVENMKAETGYISLGKENLDQVNDPSVYSYQNRNDWFTTYVEIGDVVLFKFGDSFSGVQVVNFDTDWMEFKWKFWPGTKTLTTAKANPKAKAKPGDLSKTNPK